MVMYTLVSIGMYSSLVHAECTSSDCSDCSPTGETLINLSYTSYPKSPIQTCQSSEGTCPKIEWKIVPSGLYTMGSDEGEGDEKPEHLVSVKAFLMSESEVTVRQYKRCVEAGVCTPPVAKKEGPLST